MSTDLSISPWDIHLGPLDPTTTKLQAGVGVMWRDNVNILPLKPLTAEFENVINTARGLIYAISIVSSNIVFIANLYCHTGGHTNKIA